MGTFVLVVEKGWVCLIACFPFSSVGLAMETDARCSSHCSEGRRVLGTLQSAQSPCKAAQALVLSGELAAYSCSLRSEECPW